MNTDGSAWFTESASDEIGHVTPAGVVTQTEIPDNVPNICCKSPQGIVRGPDGNFWFTEYSFIGEIIPATGVINQFPLPTPQSGAASIIVGSDNNLWFTEGAGNIGELVLATHQIVEYPIPNGHLSLASGITLAPGGKMWFTESATKVIGSITTAGAITQCAALPSGTTLDGIAATPDGNIWFTDNGTIGRLNPNNCTDYTLFNVPQAVFLHQITPDQAGGLVFTTNSGIGRIDTAGRVAFLATTSATGIAVSADNAIWFTEVNGNAIGRVAPNYFTRVPSEFYGESNPAEPGCTTCLSSDPVNVATGNLTESATDLAVPARGVPFSFSRTYNAFDAATATASGPLGFGWTFGYNASLSVSGSGGTVTVRNGNGSTVQFVPNSTGYSAAARVIATLVHNGDGTYTYTLPSQMSEVFSSSGLMTSLVDRHGYVTTLSYASGKLSGISDPSGRTMTVAWTGTHITSVTSPLGRVVQYGYNAGNLITVTSPGLNIDGYTYDSLHRLKTITRPRGGTVKSVFDTSNRVTSQTNERTLTTTFAYTAGQTTVTDPAANISIYGVDDAGNITTVTRGSGTPQAATTTYTYDDAGDRLIMTDPLGHQTVSTYDPAANLLTQKDPLGHQYIYTYDSSNELLTAKDPLGVTTTNVYVNGNLTSTSRPLVGTGSTQTSVFHYDDPAHPGDLTSMTDPDGKVWLYGYNGQGDQTSVTDPLGNKTTATFNVDGQQVTAVSARGNVAGCGCTAAYTTGYTYWPDGQTHAVTDPLGHVTSRSYDADGNLSSLVDADGNPTGYAYDLADELTTTTRADTTTLQYGYDSAGNKASYTDAASHVTTYLYDPLNRVNKVTTPGTRVTTYTYDLASNLLTSTDPASLVTTYGYDNANRKTSISYSDSTTHGVIYTYDSDGQRATMTDAAGTTTYTVDSLHRTTQVSRDSGGPSVSSGYNLRNLLTSVTYATGKQVTYGYDDAGRATSVQDWLNNTTTLTPDPDGNTTAVASPNGVTAASTFNHSDQLTGNTDTQGATTLASFGYTPDPAGQTQSMTTTGTPQGNETYTYTPLNQLKTVNGNGYSYDTADDPTGLASGATQTFHTASTLCWSNPTTVTSPTCASAPGTATTYTSNSRGDRITTAAPGQPAAAYGYDQPSRLTSYTKGTTSATYNYDGDGLRTSKTVNGTTTPFTWTSIGGLPQLVFDGTTYLIYSPTGMPVEQITGTTPSYLHTDQLGSIRLITNATGAVTGAYAYDAYGNQTGHTGTATCALQYAGQYLDTETNLYYLRARYYDPNTAQFLTGDPLVAITQSAYGYAYDNPLNGIDPSGLDCGWTSLFGCASNVGSAVAHATLDAGAVPPYLMYYAAYSAATKINSLGDNFGTPGQVAAHILNAPLVPIEIAGLTGDAAIDWIKNSTVSHEPICDEGQVGHINPFHDWWPDILGGPGPEMYFPGIHSNGQIDFSS